MNISYTLVASMLFCLFDATAISAQPIFLDTTPDSIPLCTNDPGVKLPATNQLYLGEGHHGASSCSVHLTQSTKVKIDCGTQVQYEIRVVFFDTSAEYVLRPLTTISTDSLSEAELIFDTEFSPEFEIMQHGIPYTSGCYRYHRIKWIVTDECGGSAVMEKLVDVYDCSAPQVEFSSAIYVLYTTWTPIISFNIDTIISTWVDDCTAASELLISLRSTHHKTDSILDACEAPAFGVELPFPVFIADKGRDLNCDGTIEWDERFITESHFIVVIVDNNSVCEPWIDYYIAGEILTEDQQPVEKVEVTLTSPGYVFPVYVTGSDGKYNFGMIPPGPDFEISCERNDNYKNGVSTLDLVRIQKHLLGIDEFTSPYDLIAADANNSQNVSAIDLIELRKLILSIYEVLPANRSWKFIPEGYDFENPKEPFLYPEKIVIHNFGSSSIDLDFIAVKVGDVNNTVQPNANNLMIRHASSLLLNAKPQSYTLDDLITIPIYSSRDFVLKGFQFTLSNHDLEFVNVTSGQIEIEDDAYALFDDHMTFSWYDLDPVQINEELPLFSIIAHAKRNGSLSENLKINSEITLAEVYDTDQNIYEPRLSIQSEEHFVDNDVTVYPNPWKDEIHISFEMSDNGSVDFKLLDALGSEVYSIEKEVIFGENIITVNKEDVSTTGLLFYKLSTNDFRATGVVVKPD